jgi:hypothetical protein
MQIHTPTNVAKASMKSAAEETKQFYEPEEDGVYHISISLVPRPLSTPIARFCILMR